MFLIIRIFSLIYGSGNEEHSRIFVFLDILCYLFFWIFPECLKIIYMISLLSQSSLLYFIKVFLSLLIWLLDLNYWKVLKISALIMDLKFSPCSTVSVLKLLFLDAYILKCSVYLENWVFYYYKVSLFIFSDILYLIVYFLW